MASIQDCPSRTRVYAIDLYYFLDSGFDLSITQLYVDLEMIFKLIQLLVAFTFVGWVNAAPEKKVVDGVTYHILKAQSNSIKIIWKDRKGSQLRAFPEVARYFRGEGITASTLMKQDEVRKGCH